MQDDTPQGEDEGSCFPNVLPVELLHMICAFLEVEQLLRLCLVNKRLSAVVQAPQLWRDMVIKEEKLFSQAQRQQLLTEEEKLTARLLEEEPTRQPLFVGKIANDEEEAWRLRIIRGLRLKRSAFLVLYSSSLREGELCFPFSVGNVEYTNSTQRAVDLQYLSQFVAVLVIGGNSIKNNKETSDALAEYVEKNIGGVVIARAANQVDGNYCVKGRFLSEGLHPLSPGNADCSGHHGNFDDGKNILHPNHPILADVHEAGPVWRCGGEPAPGAEVIATWDDGRPFVVVLRKETSYGMVVTVNAGCEVAPKDGNRLLVNAMIYAALQSGSRR
ncbi:hypothetical protein QOT17_016266 [Balamuthia mandrillaris]